MQHSAYAYLHKGESPHRSPSLVPPPGRTTRPAIALAMGDPAGISPELTAKVLALPEIRDAADCVVVGDARLFAAGARTAGVQPQTDGRRQLDERPLTNRPAFLDLGHLDPAGIALGVATRAGGEF